MNNRRESITELANAVKIFCNNIGAIALLQAIDGIDPRYLEGAEMVRAKMKSKDNQHE